MQQRPTDSEDPFAHIGKIIDLQELEPPEDHKRVVMYEKQSTVDSFEPYELSKKSSEVAIWPRAWLPTLKELFLMRTLHIVLSVDLPKKSHSVPLGAQKQLLEGILT